MTLQGENAPIIVFAYKRVDHLSSVIDSLKSNPESKDSMLYLYSDAPANESDIKGVSEVREYIHEIEGFAEVCIIEREINYGIERSELEGITDVLCKHGMAIIVEDDIQVSNQFLKYMNYGLKQFRYDKSVYTLTGYSFMKTVSENDDKYGFTRSFSAWGWGTWADRWSNLKRSITKKDLKKVFSNRRRIDNGQDYSYLLLHQYKTNSITWDVAWYLTCYLNEGLTVFPYNTMVNNIGMDGSGVHYKDSNKKNRIESLNDRHDVVFPIELEDIDATTKKLVTEKKAANPKSLYKRLKMFARFWIDALFQMTIGENQVEIKQRDCY